MKKTMGMLAFIFGAVLFSSMAYADPPQDVKIGYDLKSQILTVTITHKSSYPGFHYIKLVEIKKNGVVVGTNNYDTQPDVATFTYTYKVPVGKGDALEVNAVCSLSGSKTATLDVKK